LPLELHAEVSVSMRLIETVVDWGCHQFDPAIQNCDSARRESAGRQNQ